MAIRIRAGFIDNPHLWASPILSNSPCFALPFSRCTHGREYDPWLVSAAKQAPLS